MRDQLRLMGTGDSLGVPRIYCECSICQEARTSGANRRTRPSALLRGPGGDLLIDCGPDFRTQMERAGLRHVERVLVTHGHHDHIAGVGDLSDSVRSTDLPVRLLGPAPVLDEIRARYPWAVSWIPMEPVDGPTVVAGWSVTCWPVNHGHNGRSFAYRFERPGFTWAYCAKGAPVPLQHGGGAGVAGSGQAGALHPPFPRGGLQGRLPASTRCDAGP